MNKNIEEINDISNFEAYNFPVVIICKEYHNGQVLVHKAGTCIFYELKIKEMQLRMRYNPGLSYYVMLEENYNKEETREYVFNLIKKGISSNLYTYV